MVMAKPTLRERLLWAGVPALVLTVLIIGGILYRRTFDPVPKFPHATVQIEHAHRKPPFSYDMEIATTPPQQAYGLMFRRSLAANAGMLFVWDHDQPIAMWMKNTYIPLDMLFIRHDGVIVKIIAHAVPFDLTPLPSDEPVLGVIEIGGGEAGRLGIETGDKVIYPAFSKAP